MKKATTFLLLIFAVIILCLILFYLTKKIISEKQAQSFNLILISVDTLRSDHMGIYGYDKDTTPNIDRWAKEAQVFTNAYTVVPATYPSFAALMTGHNPFKSKIDSNRLEGIVPISKKTATLATVLKKQGYYTAGFVTNGWLNKYTNISMGFNEYNLLEYNPYDDVNKNSVSNKGILNKKDYEKFLDKSIEWIGKNKDKKMFLWIHLITPHAPYDPPEELRCAFNNAYCDLFSKETNQELEQERNVLKGCSDKSLDEITLDKFKTLYDGSVAYTDRWIGKIIKKIEDTSLDKKSLVIFYSDHGEGFDHNYYFFHGTVLYDSSTKIPLIIKSPFYPKGQMINTLVDNTDILPTIYSLLHISTNDTFDGISFSDSLNNGIKSNNSKKKYTFSVSTDAHKASVYDGRYKYISSLDNYCLLNSQTEELYDLSKDPKELDNIVGRNIPTYKQLKKVLRDKLTTYNFFQSIPEIQNQKLLDTEKQELMNKLKSFGY